MRFATLLVILGALSCVSSVGENGTSSTGGGSGTSSGTAATGSPGSGASSSGTSSTASGTGASTGTATGSSGGTCLGSGASCSPGQACCEASESCAMNVNQAQVCCVPSGVSPPNQNYQDCCSQILQGSVCVPAGGTCVMDGTGCTVGQRCCDDTASCALNVNQAQVCCVPDGASADPGGPSACCALNVVHGDCGACIPTSTNCAPGDLCCEPNATCTQYMNGPWKCCVASGEAPASGKAADCCSQAFSSPGVCL